MDKKCRQTHRNIDVFDYPYHPNVDCGVWEKLKPYFLPLNHPIKSTLDHIFESGQVILNREKFVSAGFKASSQKKPGNLVVGLHPHLRGFLVKAYFDHQDVCEWDNYLKRVMGAQSLQRCIQNHGYEKKFKVPKKWIYPLPLKSLLSHNPLSYQKNFVLIVEDMEILNDKENKRIFKNQMTPLTLDRLYEIITEEGLIDSVFRDNIPYNKFGKICFIDTEHHHLWPINYYHLKGTLSFEMGRYWETITQ